MCSNWDQKRTSQYKIWPAMPLPSSSYNIVRATPIHPVTTTGPITAETIQDAEGKTETTFIRNHLHRLNRLAKYVLFPHLDLHRQQCWFGTKRNAPPTVFPPIFSDVNRQRAILPFLFGEQPSNNKLSSHSASAPRDDHEKARASFPSIARHPRWYPSNFYPGRSALK